MPEPETITADIVAHFLTACEVDAAFGVISIHNMPILDAIGRQGRIRFVPSRGEAGAVNMADGLARANGALGVAITSTGTGAGNAAGALVEALSAETALLHITGQIDSAHLDRGHGFIHETKAQLEMLAAVSKAAFRVEAPEQTIDVLRAAVEIALTPPRGPVSVEFPADVQTATAAMPNDLSPRPIAAAAVDPSALAGLANRVAAARRPLLWLGGGARHAGAAVARLMDLGIGVVTSVRGRGVVPEDHPLTLGAFNQSLETEDFYATVDLMLVVGSRLRSNETRTYKLGLPKSLVQIDVDPAASGRLVYQTDDFVCGDAASVLDGLADQLEGRLEIDPAYAADLRTTRRAAEQRLRDAIAPYDRLVDALQAAMPRDALWVRDITVANSTWGNRFLQVFGPHDSFCPAGGGIGQGMAMAVGAAVGVAPRKVVCLTGDGGLMLNIGELATAAEAQADLTLIVMNDGGYGVIRNIQDARFDGRHYYADLFTPDFSKLAAACSIAHWRVAAIADFEGAIAAALAHRGPTFVEVDMAAIGPSAVPFAGPVAR